jgi:anti-sigma factor RsiW
MVCMRSVFAEAWARLLGKKCVGCRECSEFLMAYLDSELEPEVATAFERHLKLCPPCVAYLETYKETIALARKARGCDVEAPPEPMPEHLVAAILKAKRGDGCGG